MAKQKLSPRPAKSKRYDFETPLDPFDGESLKGISAFIQSSLTLQSPSPDAAAPITTEPPSVPNSADNHQAAALERRLIPSTLDSTLDDEIKIGLVETSGTVKPDKIADKSALLSTLDTRLSSIPNTRLSSNPNTHVPSLLDTQYTLGSGELPSEGPQPVYITKELDILGTLDIDVSGIHNTSISSNPSTSVPSILDTAVSAKESRNTYRFAELLNPSATSTAKHALGHEEPSVLDTQMSRTPDGTGPSTFHSPSSAVPNTSEPPGPQQALVRTTPGADQDAPSPSRELSTPITGNSASPTSSANVFIREAHAPVSSTATTREWTEYTDAIDATGTGRTDAAFLDQGSIRPSERKIVVKMRPAVRGQDGLTKGEERIYTFLWRAVYGSREHGKTEFRVVADTIEISLRKLAQKVGLGLANCAWHIPCLEEKGCIVRIRESDHFHPAAYRIREFTEILQWRREHGLTHFIQRGHLAAFVDPITGVPITRFRGQTDSIYCGRVVLSTPDTIQNRVPNIIDPSTLNTPDKNVNSSTPTVHESRTPSVINSRTQVLRENHLKNQISQETSSTSSPFVASELITILHDILPSLDDEAALLLWSECRSRVPDCTAGEVVHFVNAKAAILKTGRIQNPAGFLITAVPKCFEGESFQHFRREQARLKEEQRRRGEEERRKQQAVEDEINEFRREEEARQRASELVPTLPEEERKALYEQARAELSAKGYKATGSTMEKLLHEWVIRKLAKRIQSES